MKNHQYRHVVDNFDILEVGDIIIKPTTDWEPIKYDLDYLVVVNKDGPKIEYINLFTKLGHMGTPIPGYAVKFMEALTDRSHIYNGVFYLIIREDIKSVEIYITDSKISGGYPILIKIEPIKELVKPSPKID